MEASEVFPKAWDAHAEAWHKFTGGDEDIALWEKAQEAADAAATAVIESAKAEWMAQAEGWTKNPKYKTMPEVMLRYRSAAFLVRFYAPDVMLGYQTTEEVEDVAIAAVPEAAPLSAAMLLEQAAPIEDAITEEIEAEDLARKWADAYIASVNECQDTDALNAFANSKAVKLAELQAKRSELHTECVHALDNKRAALNFTPEGRPETDTGEGFNDDTANWEE